MLHSLLYEVIECVDEEVSTVEPRKEHYRKEIQLFISACETMLSSASMEPPLTTEECDVVRFYANNLVDHCDNLVKDCKP